MPYALGDLTGPTVSWLTMFWISWKLFMTPHGKDAMWN
jgi:hypothetical protein